MTLPPAAGRIAWNDLPGVFCDQYCEIQLRLRSGPWKMCSVASTGGSGISRQNVLVQRARALVHEHGVTSPAI